ncbi:MAG: GNAT family N-acetyltransferase [Anaerolineales bacterium]|nr:GNAT family N-acetyltransferase [Anaerolineales bacterium]
MDKSIRLELSRYSEIREPEFLDYVRDWEKTGEEFVPSTVDPKGRTFAEIMRAWEREETEDIRRSGFVPATLYFLTGGGGRILGAIHFRHELNDTLMRRGGHIGYGIRQSERRKGYATAMLRQLLEDVPSKGCRKVLLTCGDGNLGSIGAIERCGGVLENKAEREGEILRRYWITLAGGG